VEECAAGDVCKPPTRFTWHHDGTPGFAEQDTPVLVPAPPAEPGKQGATAMLLDVTGDGLDDLVLADADTTGGSELPLTDGFVAPNLGPGQPEWFDEPMWASQEAHYDEDTTPDTGTPIDYDQDGRMDVLLHDVHGQYQTWQVLIAQPDHSFDRV